MAKQKRPLSIRSGNLLLDPIFERIVEALQMIKIYKVAGPIRCPANPGMPVLGFCRCGKNYPHPQIFLASKLPDSWSKEPMERNLLHELLHAIFSDYAGEASEAFIEEVEASIWIMLTPDQKKILKSYIPKHSVKKQPTL